MRWLVLLVLIAAPLIAFAGAHAQFAPTDPRIRIVDYVADQVVRIEATQGYQVTLQFGSDERIENVAVGDSSAWQVSANRRGDLLFIKPVRDGVTTNLTVATDARIYSLELSPAFADAGVPYMIRFRYAAPSEASELPGPGELIGRYRLSGAPSLRPSRIADDGVHTYIEWPEDQPLPAVYTIDRRGRETLVNGNMRDGLYVIDEVLSRLVFRIDAEAARAVRQAPRDTP